MRIGLWNFLRESYLTSKVTLSAIGNIEYALTQNNVHCAINFCHKIMELLEHYRKLLFGQGYSSHRTVGNSTTGDKNIAIRLSFLL